MLHAKTLTSTIAVFGFSLATPISAQSPDSAPSLEEYEDVGRGMGMAWYFHTNDGNPILEFGVKETSHRLDRLWEFSCANLADDNSTISNTIFAKPREVRRNDQFGFSIRIDNGKSFGLVGRRAAFDIQGTETYFPQFKIPENHSLWNALQRGERAFVNLNGNKFSIHLDGSSRAINAFLTACKSGSL